ncbi:hypothetical protein ACWEP4_36705 [Streptomyces sp. NPDC004227]
MPILHLQLDADGADHVAAAPLVGQVVQQRGFAHARLTVHHQRATLARPQHRGQQTVEACALPFAADQTPSELLR